MSEVPEITLSRVKVGDIYALLTKREVKMAGNWSSSFFASLDRDEVEVHKDAKRERGQYPAILTERAWSTKDLLHGHKVTPSISFNAAANTSARGFQNQP